MSDHALEQMALPTRRVSRQEVEEIVRGSYDTAIPAKKGRVNLWKGRGPGAVRVTLRHTRNAVIVVTVWREPCE